MSIRDVVNVTISRQTQAVTRAGFSTILVVGESLHIPVLERVRSYTSLDGLVADGFLTTDDEYKAAAAIFAQSPSVERIKVGRRDGVTPETWVQALQAIRLVDDDWYGLVTTVQTSATVQSIAAYIETAGKLYGTSSNNADTLDPLSVTDLAYLLSQSNYTRTFLIYDGSGADTKYRGAAWLGKMLATDPGAATWKFKTLAGVNADMLSDTQVQAAEAKNANTYVRIGGVSMTQQGVVASGEFIDVIVGVDWLQARITERVFSLLVNQPKVPFTDAGITAIEAEVRAQLGAGVDIGFLASDPAPTVTSPKAKDVPAVDKAARELNGVRFVATLAGAIHRVVIQGVVQV